MNSTSSRAIRFPEVGNLGQRNDHVPERLARHVIDQVLTPFSRPPISKRYISHARSTGVDRFQRSSGLPCPLQRIHDDRARGLGKVFKRARAVSGLLLWREDKNGCRVVPLAGERINAL